MKKLLIAFFSIIIAITTLTPSPAHAAVCSDCCTPNRGSLVPPIVCDVTGSCESQNFDCSDSEIIPSSSISNKSDCESQGGCYESQFCVNLNNNDTGFEEICYLSQNPPPPPITCIPFDCTPECTGTKSCEDLGGYCDCTDTPSPPTPPTPSTCTPSAGGDGVPTGLGCIPTDPTNLVKWVLQKAILAGGGIAFLLSLWGGLTILLGAGNPEKINEGKQIISSSIAGLLFIIFSVFLLRFIGVDILQLPGFIK